MHQDRWNKILHCHEEEIINEQSSEPVEEENYLWHFVINYLCYENTVLMN